MQFKCLRKKTIVTKGTKNNFHQDNYDEKITKEHRKNVKSKDYFWVEPARASVLTPHQVRFLEKLFYSSSKFYGWANHP